MTIIDRRVKREDAQKAEADAEFGLRYNPFEDDAPVAPTCEPDAECEACQ